VIKTLKIPHRKRPRQKEKEWIASLRCRWKPSIKNPTIRFVEAHSKINLGQAINLLRPIRNSIKNKEHLMGMRTMMEKTESPNFTMEMMK